MTKCLTLSSSSGPENQNNRRRDSLRRSRKTSWTFCTYGEESVSVAMEEVKSQDWVEKVYKPDIQNKWDKLYKKPRYE